MEQQAIYAIERPHPKLMTLYVLRSCSFPPFSLIALLPLYFRYHTLRYQFDDEGITMSWGILWRRKVNLTYRRIQDIHLTTGLLQRWLGLADIHIQTASGKATAEMKIEGLLEYEAIRDFLYSRMRGSQQEGHSSGSKDRASLHAQAGVDVATQTELIAVLREVAREMRLTRAAIENASEEGDSGDV